ncbi:conserved hypothetical protein [Leishmania infantum JPCM5]|uniref:Uncharacterized protein n=2 Tax=Leishmania infantum TaxID=5671 RepID=A4HSP9_LEIIN|nr:conserved hypothetical protein [Leishmania infantum JPCM5]CAC9445033.1 hypothetical_protein_-_conserved [Leishmania infantum]CAM65437.1 conserved hypothetical protein [Leishmania infantum JPCM5]SUZ39050.1 hypothetical_protein_-_conserved [Leishmania infantum]|eukprot:XP_001463090.1 conserved hypothetical protein [Leishmania infantum JPCM5]
MNSTLGSSGSAGDEAPLVGGLDALTLRTINEQQLIILRQKELVSTLKERVEELEAQPWRADVKPLEAAHKADGRKGTLSYVSEMQLRRRVKTLEDENKKLSDLVDELRAEVSTISAQLYAQQLHTQSEKDVWKAKVRNAEAKSVATAHLLEATDKRNQQLFHHLEKLRREGEVSAYECAQWRSLATTTASHLDHANRRYARDQINSIEEDVHRYAVNRLRLARVAPSASLSLESETPEETRKMWSRSAQLPKFDPAPQVFQQQQQEPVCSQLHVSHQRPLSQLLPCQPPQPTASHALAPPASKHVNAETHPSPSHCAALAQT